MVRASSISQIINNRFGGIRRNNPSFSSDLITCSDCQNVELFYTELNSGIGLRCSNGNISVSTYNDKLTNEIKSIIPPNEYIIEIFEANLNSEKYLIVYTENETKGKLYQIDLGNRIANNIDLSDYLNDLYSKTYLSVTKKASATQFTQGYKDEFIFSNGEELVYLFINTERPNGIEVENSSDIGLINNFDTTTKGLGLCVFDGRLWLFNGKSLIASRQADCRHFKDDDTTGAMATYIETVKNITAIYPYLGTIAVFHKDSSALLKVDTTTGYLLTDESPGGCASYRSLVFHGTDLYFYDDTKKGVFSFKQVINGDKTLGDNIALDLQQELVSISSSQVDRIKALSVVTKDRNEVWFLVPIESTYEKEIEELNEETGKIERKIITLPASIILIFDYLRGEWIKRKCQLINTISVYNDTLYSAGKEIYEEYQSNAFDGDFIPSYYDCSVFNLGVDNTMKITKFPPRITIDGTKRCKFWCKYIKNYNINKKPKIKEVKSKKNSIIYKYDTGVKYDSGATYLSKGFNTIIKLPSATFKALQMTFYTTKINEKFSIKAFEISKLKVKQI